MNQDDIFDHVFTNECIFILKCVGPSADISKNLALRENVLAMFVSILNKIPLFLTGIYI